MLKRSGTLLGALAGMALAPCAHGQALEARLAVRGGFFLGPDFYEGHKTHLEGFEIGADFPLIRMIPKVGGISFSPTVTFGGSNRSGADTDGNIYHLLVNFKRGLSVRGLYAGFGLGYSLTDAKINEFRNVNGFATQYLLGYTFPYAVANRYHPFLELSYHDGPDNKLRGVALDAGLRF